MWHHNNADGILIWYKAQLVVPLAARPGLFTFYIKSARSHFEVRPVAGWLLVVFLLDLFHIRVGRDGNGALLAEGRFN